MGCSCLVQMSDCLPSHPVARQQAIQRHNFLHHPLPSRHPVAVVQHRSICFGTNVAVHARPTSRPIESECDEQGPIVERLVVGRSMEPLVGPEIHSGCFVRLSEWGALPHAVKSDLV